MRELKLLLKNNLLANYGINKLAKEKVIKKVLYALAAIYVIGSLMFSFGIYAVQIADTLEKTNMLPFMLIIFFVFASFTTFMFTINSAKGSLFGSKDNDLLFSMPIKSSSILLSRLIVMIAWNLLSSLIVLIPIIVVYLSKVDVNLIFYLYIFVVFLLLPVIPTIIASFFGYIIAYFISKSNKKNCMEIILLFVLTFGIYFLIYNGSNMLNSIIQNQELVQNILKYGFYPIYLVGEVISKSDITSFIMFIVINVVSLVAFIYVLEIKYKSIISRLQENRTKSNYVMKELKTSSINKALFIKELKRYFSSPIYVMNTAIGSLMLVVFAIATIFFDKDQILQAMNFSALGGSFFPIVIAIFAFVIFMTTTTSSSVSIEGKNFWIVKSLPINYKSLLNAKLYLNYVIVLPIAFLSIIILKFSIDLSTVEMLILFVFSVICAICEAQFGLLVNLKYPKMDAINDEVIVKRSLSSMIAVLGPMMLIIIIAGIGSELIKIMDFNILLLIITIILCILIIIERKLLYSWGVERVKEID